MGLAAVDIGNTSINLLVWDDNDEVKFKRYGAFRSITDIIPFFNEIGVRNVAYSTTRDLNDEEQLLVKDKGWWKVTADSVLPIKLEYATPETLGLDRLMAATAVSDMFPGEEVMIADAGTALTLDFISAEGCFRGGNISAGLSMRLRALHDYTSRLPMVESLVDNEGNVGKNTTQAIQYGAVWGVAYEIAGTLAFARKNYGCSKLLVAGGDSLFLMKFIRQAVDLLVPGKVELVLKEDVVAYGLKIAYEFNHDK